MFAKHLIQVQKDIALLSSCLFRPHDLVLLEEYYDDSDVETSEVPVGALWDEVLKLYSENASRIDFLGVSLDPLRPLPSGESISGVPNVIPVQLQNCQVDQVWSQIEMSGLPVPTTVIEQEGSWLIYWGVDGIAGEPEFLCYHQRLSTRMCVETHYESEWTAILPAFPHGYGSSASGSEVVFADPNRRYHRTEIDTAFEKRPSREAAKFYFRPRW